MNLDDYIKKVGDAEFAAKFGITPRAALSYRMGDRSPRPKLAKRIVAATPVTWAGIYNSRKDS